VSYASFMKNSVFFLGNLEKTQLQCHKSMIKKQSHDLLAILRERDIRIAELSTQEKLLEHAIKSLTQTIQKLENGVLKTEEEIQTLQSKILKQQGEISRLSSKIVELKQALRHLEVALGLRSSDSTDIPESLSTYPQTVQFRKKEEIKPKSLSKKDEKNSAMPLTTKPSLKLMTSYSLRASSHPLQNAIRIHNAQDIIARSLCAYTVQFFSQMEDIQDKVDLAQLRQNRKILHAQLKICDVHIVELSVRNQKQESTKLELINYTKRLEKRILEQEEEMEELHTTSLNQQITLAKLSVRIEVLEGEVNQARRLLTPHSKL
jgi:cell division protein FtsL